MKRISFLMITILMTVGMVMAQGPRKGEKKQIDPKVRAEKITERMATEYGLNDSQKAKLLDLNLTMTEKMGERPAHRNGGAKRDARKGRSETKRQKDATAKKPEVTKEQREKRMAEMKKVHENYQKEIKGIFTAEQYQKYEAKQIARQEKMKESRKGNKEKRRATRLRESKKTV